MLTLGFNQEQCGSFYISPLQEGKLSHSTDNFDVLAIILSVGALVIILAAVGMFVWKKYKKKKAMQVQDKVVEVGSSGGGAPKNVENPVTSLYSHPPTYDQLEDEE